MRSEKDDTGMGHRMFCFMPDCSATPWYWGGMLCIVHLKAFQIGERLVCFHSFISHMSLPTVNLVTFSCSTNHPPHFPPTTNPILHLSFLHLPHPPTPSIHQLWNLHVIQPPAIFPFTIHYSVCQLSTHFLHIHLYILSPPSHLMHHITPSIH
jgi:hypothetical protein